VSIRDDIKERVDEITSSHGLGKDHRGFAYWFLEEIEDFGQEEAQDLVTDGPWDKGRDAVSLDEDEDRLTIYQFKYSENLAYARSAFTDIQSGVRAEEDRLHKISELRLVVVTTATADDDLQKAAKAAQRRVRTWLTKNNHKNVQASVELMDLNHFKQVFETLYGISLTVEYRLPPLRINGAFVGLVNAADFQQHLENEALFAFNIRKFLGLRKGSVNWQMKQTLEQDDERDSFWTYNNGIVCLGTEIREVPGDPSQLDIDNFTIVNGAQTVNTIARFLNENPAVTEPVWVVCKLVQVAENDLDRARTITKTSNTQTPTSNKDLRAIDMVHRRLAKWFESHFGLTYIYRRGVRAPKGIEAITMKDVLQAYAAYWREKPEMAFSRVGQLFSSDVEYSAAFPSEDVAELKASGTEGEVRALLVDRVLPWRLLTGVRTRLATKVASGLDKRWKSSAYHVLWLYRRMFDLEGMQDREQLLARAGEIVDASADDLVDAFVSFCVSRSEDIPRALKREQLATDLIRSEFLEQQPLAIRARAALPAALG
jgi:hypothetical protein